MHNNNKPIVCKFIKPIKIFGCKRRKREVIWKAVLTFPNVFTLIGINAFISANLCLMAMTRNSLETIINEAIRKNIESNVRDNNIIVTTTRSLSAIGSKNAPNGVYWLNFLAIKPSK